MAIVITDCVDCGEKITTLGICEDCGADAEAQAVETSQAASEEFLPPINSVIDDSSSRH